MAVIANGGRLVTPRLLAGPMEPGGELTVEVGEEMSPQVIERETASQVRRVLADVVVRGTGQKMLPHIERWNAFGKTGTAHRTMKGQYNQDHYVSSFVGGAPYEAPRLVIAVSIYDADKNADKNAPGKGHHGGTVSAPLAARILNRSLEYLDVPDSPDLPEPPPHIAQQLWNYRPAKKAD
jgi:cell division protein FtsI/penicillin-binding protein 2